VDYITKPLQFEEIHARVETHLNQRRMQIHLEEMVNEKVRELTESENRFRTLHNATFSGICIHDKRKQAEENLRLANETLEQRVLQRTLELEKAHTQMIIQEKMASIGHLVAGISHELNNPLCFIAADINALSEYLEDIIDVLQAYRQWTATIQNKIEFLPETLSLQNKEAEVELDYILDDIPILLKETRSGFERINRIIQSLCSFSQVNRNADLTNVQHQHRY